MRLLLYVISPIHAHIFISDVSNIYTHRTEHRLAEEEKYLKMTAREIRRLCMLTLAFIRQAGVSLVVC